MPSDAAESLLAAADDRTLAGRSLDGDSRAFAALVRRHTPLLRSYARRFLGAGNDVDDVVQEAFVACWQQLGTIEDHGAIRSWLMRTVSHKCVDRIRSRRDHDDLDQHEVAIAIHLTPEARAVATSREEALESVLSRLPANQRECWLLKNAGGLSYQQIASQLELPVSTVRGLLARARTSVMTEMEAWR